ncbi:MAG: hypothetical protein NTV22_14820, partial [bacterium]|nr:hypothetical protein [bacterium]
HPSSDRGVCFRAHDQVDIVVRLFSFACPDLATLFAEFMRVRTTLTPAPDAPCLLPFSAAWQILEEKHNRENWCAEYGFYATATNAAQLQPGWVGGLMATHPLLLRGTALSRDRVARTFDFISDHGCAPSGFLKAIFDHGHWRDDGFRPPLSDQWLMTRKSADVLYFMLKQFMLMDRQSGFIKPSWRAAARACADAFVRTWLRDGQFGQFVHADTGAIIVGGSAAAGMAPAGLALAARFFNDQSYLQTALASAQYFNRAFVQRGYTLGGPGEICQCPDSESAFSILEAFVVLLEVTGARRWRDAAEAVAGQCASWCMSYDYQFPPASTFGRMHMRTTGTVFASVQNKHSAPGICTLSGDALFKLFRATGRHEYLALARDIAHALPQYLSRTDRPIHAPQGPMPTGWICERVNTSDWCEPIGEIFHGSCWCEVSLMLTIVELPGVYVQPDTGLVCAFDHVNARLAPAATIAPAVIIDNPTSFDAEVSLLVETAADAARRPLGQNGLCDCRRVHVPAGGAATVALRG